MAQFTLVQEKLSEIRKEKHYKTAKQMSAISLENNPDDFNIVMEQIEISAKKGNCHICFEVLSTISIRQLEQLGYSIKVVQQTNYNPGYFKVSW